MKKIDAENYISKYELIDILRDEIEWFESLGNESYDRGAIYGLQRAIEKIKDMEEYDALLEPISMYDRFNRIYEIIEELGDKTLNELFEEYEEAFNAREYFAKTLIDLFISAFISIAEMGQALDMTGTYKALRGTKI